MDNLPIQLHHHLAKYLDPFDLKNMRLMNKKWDEAAKNKLQGQGFNFIFQDVEMLIEFNKIFVNCDPIQYFSSSKFTFMLPVLDSTRTLPHLNTFVQTFGTSVTCLILNFDNPEDYKDGSGSWATDEEKGLVDRHVTLLLSSVKNQIVELQFQSYTGLDPSVLGADPFPVLTNVKIQYNHIYTSGNPERRDAGYVASNEEACILDLSQKIPAIQNFAFERYHFSQSDSPTYLPAVLQNVVRVSPNVLCQLEFVSGNSETDTASPADTRAAEFVQAVVGVPVKLSGLSTTINRTGTEEDLQTILGLISRNADTLKKLSFGTGNYRNLSDYSGSLHGLKFPPLPVLEELNYFQFTEESLLGFNSSDHYPNLRKVSTFFTANDFLVPHPTVLDLTLELLPPTGYGLYEEGIQDEAEVGRRILATFPNITNLSCNAAFFRFQSFFNFTALKKLKITRKDYINTDRFWDSVTQNAPIMALDRILALEAPAEREIVTDSNGNVLLTFQDFQNLQELTLSIQHYQGFRVKESLDAIVYASKFKKLQRLNKIVIELGAKLHSGVPKAYLDELKKYHDDVVVVQQTSIYS